MSEKQLNILSIIGARPQFIKVAPICHLLKKTSHMHDGILVNHEILHTGQHYDYEMNKVFFDQMDIPAPDENLEVGSGRHGAQTGIMLQKIENRLIRERPDLAVVYGDTNSTMAGALAAAKLGISVAHIESGLRSFNRNMPEEINRLLTDHCSDFLFFPTDNACQNLKKEGVTNCVDQGRIIPLEKSATQEVFDFPVAVNIGDVMYDALQMASHIAGATSNILEELKIESKKYFLATLHRAENTDDESCLRSILSAFQTIGDRMEVIFPIHPRTKKMIQNFDIDVTRMKSVRMIEPVGFFDMKILLKNSSKLLTDSGGMQKEAYFSRIPCLTLRDETEWIETLENGNNVLTGADAQKIVEEAFKVHVFKAKTGKMTPFGDGKSAQRFLRFIVKYTEILCSR